MERKFYHTKQQQAILDWISQRPGSYVTVAEVSEHLKRLGYSVGKTTIYRHLERLEAQGMVNRIKMEGVQGNCYQYCGSQGIGEDHFYMKCEGCGQLVDLECDHLGELYRHVQTAHHIALNPNKTMFYGRCTRCIGEQPS